MLTTIKKSVHNLQEIDTIGMPGWKKLGIRSVQTLSATLRDLKDGQISLQAMSLVYTTLITLVPLLAISFSVLKGFGVHNRVEPFMRSLLEGLGPEKSEEVSQKVIEFVDNVNVGVLGAIGLAFLLYAVIALMQKIEAAFNYIWRVAEDRNLAQRFSSYLSVLLMGPLLVFISAGITTAVRNSEVAVQIGEYTGISLLYDMGTFALPWLVIAIGFTFFYVYMPNTKVRITSAFVGGLVAGLLWKFMGFIFSAFIAGSANYVAIYAAFATIIVLMIWLYVSWLIILIGANISFYVQYPRYLRVTRLPIILTPRLRMLLGLSILTHIAKAHYAGDEPWSLDALSKKMNVPILAVQQVLTVLESGRVIVCSNTEDMSVYYPAVPFDTTPIEFAITVLEREGGQNWMHHERVHIAREASSILDKIEHNRQSEITSTSIADCLVHP